MRVDTRRYIHFVKYLLLLNMATACLDDPVAQLYWIMVTCLAYFMAAAIIFPWRAYAANYMDLCVHASVILLASVLSNFSEADEQVTENLGAFAVVMSCMPALALGSAFLLVMHPEVYGRFFPDGARSRLDNQSKTIKNVCDAIAALPDADLRELILHLGEWERTTLMSACSAVSVELGYEKGKRLTDQKLHKTGSKSAELRSQKTLEMEQAKIGDTAVNVGRLVMV